MLVRGYPMRRRRQFAKHAVALLLLATLSVAAAGSANAGVQIRGTAKALRLDVTKTSIADVLSALEPGFHVQYRSELPLDREIDGSYRGSLRRVLSRLLKGYNYFVKRDGTAVEIVIFEKQQQIDPSVSRQRDRNRHHRRRRTRR